MIQIASIDQLNRKLDSLRCYIGVGNVLPLEGLQRDLDRQLALTEGILSNGGGLRTISDRGDRPGVAIEAYDDEVFRILPGFLNGRDRTLRLVVVRRINRPLMSGFFANAFAAAS